MEQALLLEQKPQEPVVQEAEVGLDLWAYMCWLEDKYLVGMYVEGKTESVGDIEFTNELWRKTHVFANLLGISFEEAVINAMELYIENSVTPYDAMLCLAIHGILEHTYFYDAYLVG
jgi:hypothetical protein